MASFAHNVNIIFRLILSIYELQLFKTEQVGSISLLFKEGGLVFFFFLSFFEGRIPGSELREERRSDCRLFTLRVLESFSNVFPWRQAVFFFRPDPCVGEEYAFLAACLKEKNPLPQKSSNHLHQPTNKSSFSLSKIQILLQYSS